MKIFHISDLHLGKNVNGFSMIEDQMYILEQILKHIDDKNPDVVAIAGDVYDKSVPSVEAVNLFDDFLTKLAKRQITTMIISGNHDSAERMDFASRIISDKGIHIYGNFNGKIQKITLEDEFGEIDFYMLPFVRPFTVRNFFEDSKIESYEDAIETIINDANIDFQRRNVLIAHQFFAGSGQALEQSDSEISAVGGIDNISTKCISMFDYVALGHLHKSQKSGLEHVRYSGSILKYSMSECNHEKGATLINIKSKGDLEITKIPLVALKDMRKIKGPIEEIISKEISAQGNVNDYLHVVLTDEDEIIDAIGKVRTVYPNVMTLSFENSRTNAQADFSLAEEKDSASPLELFEHFFFEQNGLEAKQSQKDIVKKFLEPGGAEDETFEA